MHYYWGINVIFSLRWRIADCPNDAASYIHRGCSTARYDSVRRAVLFLLHTEMKMLERL
ncbi:putative RNA helicase [Helianthus anomalus]